MYSDRLFKFLILAMVAVRLGCAQSISSGTVTGTINDPTGAVIANARIELRNAVTDYRDSQITDTSGTFRFNNVPPNNYRITAEAKGFAPAKRDVDVRSALPVSIDISLSLTSASTTVDVEANANMVESDPSAHQDVDRSSFLKLPTFDPGGQLSQAITYSSGGLC